MQLCPLSLMLLQAGRYPKQNEVTGEQTGIHRLHRPMSPTARIVELVQTFRPFLPSGKNSHVAITGRHVSRNCWNCSMHFLS